MSEQESTPAGVDSEAQITLGLLNAVHENETLTQRSAASQLGIALGLTNAYLKRCIKKGLIKVQQIPPNRYAYYLTPQGFAEKSRLTAEYLSGSFTFFRRARNQCAELLDGCETQGWRRVALYGKSDLAEIAVLCAAEYPVELIGVVDTTGVPGELFLGLPVVGTGEDLGRFDVVLLTDLAAPQESFEHLTGTMASERILVPEMLGVSQKRTSGSAGEAR